MDSIWTVAIGFIGAIIGALIGGYMTMFASSKATKEAFEYNRIFQEQIRLQRIKSFLLGVRTEINAVIGMYESEYLEVISAHKDGTPLDWIYPLDQNYFNFYENN